MAVFVERTLTARKGRTRKMLTLRVHAPRPDGTAFRCRAELLAGSKRVWPKTPFRGMGGADSWQALVLTMRIAVLQLVLFERETAMRIDEDDWMDVVDLLGDMPIPRDMRRRIAEIERTIAEALREFREEHEHDHDHDHEHDHEHAAPARKRVRRRTKR